MLWIRSAVFTLLVPGLVAVFTPQTIVRSRSLQPDAWRLGWVLVVLGSGLYVGSLLSFLSAHGTPAIFFTRPLRSVLGEEPSVLVHRQLYKFTRNPMYAGVVMVIFGQAALYADLRVALYGVAAFICFHAVVVFLEEPHSRARQGEAFDQYCRAVPRWVGLPAKHN